MSLGSRKKRINMSFRHVHPQRPTKSLDGNSPEDSTQRQQVLPIAPGPWPHAPGPPLGFSFIMHSQCKWLEESIMSDSAPALIYNTYFNIQNCFKKNKHICPCRELTAHQLTHIYLHIYSTSTLFLQRKTEVRILMNSYATYKEKSSEDTLKEPN